MNHLASPFCHGGEHALSDEHGAPLPHLTPQEVALKHITDAIAIHGSDLRPEHIESVVTVLKRCKLDAIAVRDIPSQTANDRRSKRRHRNRQPIRKALRAMVVAIQARMTGRAQPNAKETQEVRAFRLDMEGIKDRRYLTRLESRSYLWSWLSRGMSLVFFVLIGILAFLYVADNVHWTSRAIVLLAAMTAYLVSDKLMLDAGRLYARCERLYFLACLRKARDIDDLDAAGLFDQVPARGEKSHKPSAEHSDLELATLSDKLYRA